MTISFGTKPIRKNILMYMYLGFVKKENKMKLDYMTTPSKDQTNMASNACQKFGVTRNTSFSTIRFYGKDEIMCLWMTPVTRY